MSAEKKEYNKIKKKARYKYNKAEGIRIAEMAEKQPKQFWKNINKFRKHKNKQVIIEHDDLFHHFKNLLEQDAEVEINKEQNTDNDTEQNDTFLDCNITMNEIIDAVYSQNNGKCPGMDKVTAEIYKCSFTHINNFLVRLFNKIFNDGTYPEAWGDSIIVPIFKGGNPEEPKNYRGVSLINILGKIYSQILLNRLTKWSEQNDVINQCQFGFQSKKSTTDCIFILTSLISKTLANKQKLYCAFIDFEKAFDKINRLLLWNKLLEIGVSTKMVNSLKAMYSYAKSYVMHNPLDTSKYIETSIGLKQGDPSSSLLFIFFINDMLTDINSAQDGIITISNTLLYSILFADDTVLYAHNPETLQSLLDELQQYCSRWGLSINTDKTKTMIFENGRHTTYDFKLNGRLIENVKEFKYLGLNLTKNNNWNRTQKNIAQRASSSLHSLSTILNNLELPSSTKLKLFDSLIEPIINYSAGLTRLTT